MSTTEQSRKRGRQAEAERNDLELLRAARDVVATAGAEASVAAIAERAGVGIGSLYRRYPTKEALFQHLCVLALEQAAQAAETGLNAETPWDGLVGYIRACVNFRTGALAPLAGVIAVTDRMNEANERSMRLVDELVTRTHRAGALRTDVTALDVSLLIEQFSRRSATTPDDEDENTRQRLLAIALDGLRPAAAVDSLPGHQPRRDAYVGRWNHPGPATGK